MCIEAAAAGEPEGLAVLAREQTVGRGTRGRTWSSPVGNLYLSVLLRPTEPASSAGLWSLLAAVALREALGAGPIVLKWPNDLMLGEGKLAGILLESGAEGASLNWLVIGFGANLAVAPAVPYRSIAALHGGDVEATARAVLAQLDDWRAKGLQAARRAWLKASYPIGTFLRLARPDIEGAYQGISEEGALLLARPDGLARVFSGEVVTHDRG
jgi:BirA family biotin operon repressor/biotin-[acetyl-CoA-carboxylase] ligase